MKDNLYIVESPTKANMVKNLGFEAIYTLGHISEIDTYTFLNTKEIKIIPKNNNFSYIKDKIKKCKGKIIIGTDPDIEGEMIAYTISQIAIKENKDFVRNPLYGLSGRKLSDFIYMKNVSEINLDMVKSGLSRTTFDLILSNQFQKVLKKDIDRKINLGRVQHSILLMLKEYKNYFVYTIGFYRMLTLRKIKSVKTSNFKNTVLKIPDAYNTYTLFQDGINMFKLSLEEISKILQTLYINGAISYPRTEGIALEEATYNKLFMKANDVFSLNKKYFLGNYENAISPLNLDKKFNGNLNKIFNLIIRRSIASMLNNYITNSIEYKILFNNDKMKRIHLLEDNKNIISKVYIPDYVLKSEEEHTPYYLNNGLTEYEILKLLNIYNIGKPSTIPSILHKVTSKEYVEKEYDDTYTLTELGSEILKVLNNHFDFLNLKFYQDINKDFSYISKGMQNWMFPVIKLKNQLKLKNINTDIIDLNDIDSLEEIEYKKLWFSEGEDDVENIGGINLKI